MAQPNPITVGWSVLKSVMSTTAPQPSGTGTVNHAVFGSVLAALSSGGLGEAARYSEELEAYLQTLRWVNPDDLSRDEALAYWINLYNGLAVQLSVRAWLAGEDSVLRVPGGFSRVVIEVAGESLSLDAIEHGKVRRFKDPRIHAALVCGSLSCPTLRSTPYTGTGLGRQLDEQLRSFLTAGGAMSVGPDSVALSRVFLWYGSDFSRPRRMPTFLPAPRKKVLEAVRPWLPAQIQTARSVTFQDYDWGLACSVG